jgi:hypothetical protein
MSILAQQLRNPMIKPRWQAPLGVMESIVAYNCRKYGFPIPIMCMPFWEGAGNQTYDLSGNKNHGILTYGPKWSKNAIIFDAVDDYVEVADANNLDIVAPITISAWINTSSNTATDQYQTILNKGNMGTNPRAYSLYLVYDELYMYYYNLGWRSFATLTANIVANTWYHVVYTRTATTGTENFYLNGILSRSGTPAATIIANTYPLRIGSVGEPDEGEIFNGLIDNVQIYNRALTVTQVKFLYDNPYFMYKMPEELWGYGVAGTTYNMDTVFSVSTGLTEVNNLSAFGGISFAASTGLTEVNLGSFPGNLTLAMLVSLVESNIIDFQTALTLEMNTATVNANIAGLTGSSTFAVISSFAETGVISIQTALTLAMSISVTNNTIAELINSSTFSVIISLVDTGTINIQTALTLAGILSITNSNILDAFGTLICPVSAGLVNSSIASLNSDVTFSAIASLVENGYLDIQTAITFAAIINYICTVGNTFNNDISLSTQVSQTQTVTLQIAITLTLQAITQIVNSNTASLNTTLVLNTIAQIINSNTQEMISSLTLESVAQMIQASDMPPLVVSAYYYLALLNNKLRH